MHGLQNVKFIIIPCKSHSKLC